MMRKDNKKKQEKDEIITRNATEASVISQAIEVTYNSDGLPKTRRISPHIYNLYGVNGERYAYNENKQLTGIRYFSDEKGEERIEGFQGVFCEKFEYDADDWNRKIFWISAAIWRITKTRT